MSEPSRLLSIILDQELSLEERKDALEDLITSDDPELGAYLEQVLSCDSSVLRFRARREFKARESATQKAPQSIKKLMGTQTRRQVASSSGLSFQDDETHLPEDHKVVVGKKIAKAAEFIGENRKFILQVASYAMVAGVTIGLISMILGHLGREPMPVQPTAAIDEPVVSGSKSVQTAHSGNETGKSKISPARRFENAGNSFENGKLQKTEKELLAIIGLKNDDQADPDLIRKASFLLSQVRINLGNPATAWDILKDIQPESSEEFLTLARYKMTVRDYPGCVEAVGEVLALDPFDPEAPQLGFDAAIESENRKKATAFLTVLEERAPNSPETLSRAMDFYFSGGEAEKFLTISDKYRKIARETSRHMLMRGNCFKTLGKMKSAAINLDKARNMNPSLRKDPEFLYGLALIFNEVGNIDKAFLHYRQSVNLNGEMLLRTDGGILDKARTSFETVHTLSPNAPNILLQLGWVEYLTGNLEIARIHFKRVTELVDSGPMRIQADEMLGNLSNISVAQAGKTGSISVSEAPEDDSGEEEETDPDENDGPEGKDKPKEPVKPPKTGSEDKTEELVKPWVPVAVPREKLEEAEAHYRRGMIYFDSESWSEVTEELKAAFELNPNDKETILKVAEVYHNKLHMNPEAIEAYKRYLPLDPKNQNIYVNIGQLLVKEERPEEAIPWLDGAIAVDPGSSMAKYCAKIKSLVLKKVGQQGDE